MNSTMDDVPGSSSTPPCWTNIVKQTQTQTQTRPTTTTTTERDLVGSCKSTKGIAIAVVDANAIIQGKDKLAHLADKLVSVPEVISEVRDPTSRHSLTFLPFSIDTTEPSPDALKKVISFARETGDLQTLSDVDLKLIALTYTLEAEIHGTKHLRNNPPPIHTVNVKRLPEKDMPGWGSNVPNLEEWEALEHAIEDGSNPHSRILPLKDLSLNVIPTDQNSMDNGSTGDGTEPHSEMQEDADGGFRKPRRYPPKTKEVNVEGKKMVADGIDASQGQFEDNAGDWRPAVSRSTQRRFLRRKARREMYEALSEKDHQQDATENMESENLKDSTCPPLIYESSEEIHAGNGNSEGTQMTEGKDINEDISTILNQMRLEEDSLKSLEEVKELDLSCEGLESNNSMLEEYDNHEKIASGDKGSEHLEISSQNNENVDASYLDDNSSQQSWMLRSLSDSSVACVTGDFAMQNVLLQMGLRLLAPGGMQIRELHKWILKCHACFKVTMEIGKIFCPSCGNGGTLRKVAVTVGENGIVVAARRQRISLRGTKFSLPLPQSGRDAITKNPILREDQLPQKFLYPKTKKKNKQGDDIFSSDDIFLHHTDKRAPLQPPVRKALAVFSGKRNPNDNHFSRSKQ